MKTLFVAIAAGWISAMALSNDSIAQVKNTGAFDNTAWPNKLKSPVAFHESNFDNVNPYALRAVKRLTKQYKENNAKWTEESDCLVAAFQRDGINYTVYYDKKGNWVGSVKSYGEDNLPKDLRDQLRREYLDYNIYIVKELESIQNVDAPTYLVTLENAKFVKQVMINENNTSIYREFSKTK
jgi:hypothetical protein